MANKRWMAGMLTVMLVAGSVSPTETLLAAENSTKAESELEEVYLEEQSTETDMTSDFVLENGTLTKYKGEGGDVIIPTGVTSIGYYAFEGCSALESITIPESVTRIEEEAFKDCSSLKSIIIPKGITSIEEKTFEGCSSLASVTIPTGVTAIQEEAFEGCSSLENITFPQTLEQIGARAFEDSGLKILRLQL